MDTKKYKVLLRAIDSGSLTKAAEELGYTQSGVSHMIRNLEKEMGFTILFRHSTGVNLTEDGKRIMPMLRELVKWEEQLYQVTSSIKGVDIGHISIGTLTSMSVNWLPLVIKAFQKNYPNIRITLKEGGNQEIVELLEEGKLDFAFCIYPSSLDLDWLPLKEDYLMVVMPTDNMNYANNLFYYSDIEKYPFIQLPYKFDYEVHRLFEKHQIKPNVKFTSTDDYTIISMVEQGLGISILPKLVLEGYKHRKIRMLNLEPPYLRNLGIAITSVKKASPAAKKFIEYAQYIILNEI
ncbi:LysR family transcriptional regulator [Staphylococcus sp. GSSP0090]|nr:LysR family transcriptional regulator [Staphylococcus sp. GSSP0090]